MEQYIKDYLKLNLSDPIIIEAGMANGSDTKTFCELFPGGRIFGFEPVPSLFQNAHSLVKKFNNVEIYEKALSDTNGKMKMHISTLDGGICESSSLLRPKDHLSYHPHIKFDSEIEVETIKLDDFIIEKNINKIDLMWLDLQGYEPLVLESNFVSLSKTKFLFTEINILEVYENVMRWPEFYDFLTKNGFKKIWDDIFYPRDAANAFFVNTKIN